jgi:phenolic acid decarboxylase
MTIRDFTIDGSKCQGCGSSLVYIPQSIYRIPETEPSDTVACLNCGAGRRSKEVFEQHAGLIGGFFIKDRCIQIIMRRQGDPK